MFTQNSENLRLVTYENWPVDLIQSCGNHYLSNHYKMDFPLIISLSTIVLISFVVNISSLGPYFEAYLEKYEILIFFWSHIWTPLKQNWFDLGTSHYEIPLVNLFYCPKKLKPSWWYYQNMFTQNSEVFLIF